MSVSYWASIVCVAVGWVLCVCECLSEPDLKGHPAITVIAVLLVLAFGAYFSEQFLLVKAPIFFDSFAMRSTAYDPESIAGIKWDIRFSDLRVFVKNPTDRDYENIYLNINPENWTYRAAIIGENHGCHLVQLRIESIGWTIPKTGANTMTAHWKGLEEGTDVSDNVGDSFETLATRGGYRLECGRLAARDSVEIVFALTGLNPKYAGTLTANTARPGEYEFNDLLFGKDSKVSISDLVGKRPWPTRVLVNGNYRVGYKPFSVTKTLSVGDS